MGASLLSLTVAWRKADWGQIQTAREEKRAVGKQTESCWEANRLFKRAVGATGSTKTSIKTITIETYEQLHPAVSLR